jgi:hypothetical protein
MHSRADERARTHTHTHAHTHARTHTHTQGHQNGSGRQRGWDARWESRTGSRLFPGPPRVDGQRHYGQCHPRRYGQCHPRRRAAAPRRRDCSSSSPARMCTSKCPRVTTRLPHRSSFKHDVRAYGDQGERERSYRECASHAGLVWSEISGVSSLVLDTGYPVSRVPSLVFHIKSVASAYRM